VDDLGRKTWSQCIKEDLRSRNLSDNDPRNRVEWRSDVRRSSRLLSTPIAGMVVAQDKLNMDDDNGWMDLHFEEDLDLYLIKIEVPSPMDELYQV
jgi:hypothetical protein